MKKILYNGTIIMIFGALIAKVLGFIRDIALANIYGTSNIMDAYVVSNTIPNIFLACFGVAISNTIVSVFSNEKKKNGEKSAHNILNVAIILMASLSVVFIIIVLFFPNIIVKIVANGFDDNTLMLATDLTQITSFCILFISMSYVLNGFLQCNNKFFLTSFSGAYTSIIIILLVMFNISEIKYYAFAWVCGALFQFLTVYIVSKKLGYKFCLNYNKECNRCIKEILFLSIPLMISYSIQQLNIIVDKSIASSLFVGAVSSLNYANVIVLAVTAIFITSIVTVKYSKMAQIDKKRDLEIFVNKTIDMMSYLIIPISILMITLSKSVINILFVGGEFDLNALDNTYKAFSFYAIGIIFLAYRDILIRICLVKENSKLPMISNIIAVITNIVLNIILSKYMSHLGLALATSLSLLISMCILLIMIKRKYGCFFNKENFINLVKTLFINIILGFGIMLLNNTFGYIIFSSKVVNILYCIIVVVVFSALYLILMKILKINCIIEVKECLKDK